MVVTSEGTVEIGGTDSRTWQLSIDEAALEAAIGEPVLLVMATYAGELTTDGDGGQANIVGLPPEPEATLWLVEWTRTNDRLQLAWFSWNGTDQSGFVESVLTGVQPG